MNAQSGSAYSRYGIGDLDYGYSAKMLSIGDLGVTQLDPDHIVITNPAGWAALTRTRAEFSIGYKGLNVSNSSNQFFSSETEFKGFTIGFPVSQDYGIGFVMGLVPFSRVSYSSIGSLQSSDPNIPSYQVTYEGSGGLSKLFLGSSVKLPFGFLGGATLDYYFGNINYYSKINFSDDVTYINTSFSNDHRATGFGTTLGLISPNLADAFELNSFTDFRIGFSFNYISDLNADTLLTSTSNTLVDTSSFSSTKISIPPRLNGGISFVLSNMYKFNLDYEYQPWSDFKLGDVKSQNLRNAQKFSTAFEYIPIRRAGMSLWEQMVWRAGLSYEETQYKFNGQGINQYSVFGGFSFPMGIENTIDLGIEYGIRGTEDNNLLKENFVKLYLGISLGELWFLRFDK
jgi:long-subunit fatty acid transport protein